MTTMIAELYEALVDAGASEGKAKEAAQVLSTENLATKRDITELDTKLSGQITKLDQRLSGQITELDQRLNGQITELDQRLNGQITELDQRLNGQIVKLDEKLSPKVIKLERDMAVMKWMLGAALAGIAPILVAVVSMVIKIFFLA